MGEAVLLVGPFDVVKRLFELLPEPEFIRSVLFSLGRISAGFLAATVCALATAPLSSRFPFFRNLLAPLVAAVKATPVASITILLLIWISSRNLSIAISFLMVFPIMYTSIEKGIAETDEKLLEMVDVYHVPLFRKIRYVYFAEVLPYFESGVKSALSLAWKSGIAAEVIAIPSGSIGEKLFEAKVYLATADLFAWTVVVVLLSFAFERVFMALIRLARSRLEV